MEKKYIKCPRHMIGKGEKKPYEFITSEVEKLPEIDNAQQLRFSDNFLAEAFHRNTHK